MNEIPPSDLASARVEPQLPVPEPATPIATPEPPDSAEDFIYLADLPDARACADDAALAAAAQLLAHPQAQTPISIGLLGGPGGGKTSALSFVLEAAQAQARTAGLFLATVSVDAAEAGDEPETLIAAKIYDTLAQRQDEGRLGSLARESVASLRDVHAMAREGADRLAEMRQNLEMERRNLESVSGRRARLAETVLFETPGSRIDSYARAHRAKIEARLRSFGFEGDLVAVWKELVREMAERNPVEKVASCVQALWAYRGQGRLLLLTAAFAVLAWLLGQAASPGSGWTGWIKGGPMNGLAAWLGAHASLFGTLAVFAGLAAILCLAFGVLRATRFCNSILHGASLLRSDLDARRSDIDALLAHQTRRVDLLAREAETQARRAEELERRAQGPRATISRSEELRVFYGDDQHSPQARARFAREFMSAFERALVREGVEAPRLIVALDGFDGLAPAALAAFLDAAARLLARPGIAAIYALDERRAERAFGADARARLSRVFQIPLQAAPEQSDRVRDDLKPTLGFDEPLSAAEIGLLRALARFAGPHPRDAKRFANLYRLARTATAADSTAGGALAVSILESIGAFDGDPGAAQSARQTAADSGFPATSEAVQAFAPITSRFRLRLADEQTA